jgi:putative lipoic acid-binding regulatory protein
MQNEIDPYEKLKDILTKDFVWPTVYMFKFIIPSDNKKMAQVEALFDENSVQTIQPSKNGNYTSITVKEMMMSPDAVIEKLKKAHLIEGLISL